MERIRLQKFLSMAGFCSRRRGEVYISQARVKVNGEIITELGTRVDPENDRIEVDGQRLKQQKDLIYIALNKPRGYITSCEQGDEPIVIDLIDIPDRIYPVGRLDATSEGLILLTDDGELAHRIAHPSYEIDKVYEVEAEGSLSEEERLKLERGLMLDGRLTAPAAVRVVSTARGITVAEMTIHEGRKRQVRRMFELVGHPVTRLTRTQVGPVELGELPPGRWRHLNEDELRALREALEMRPE